MAHMGDFQDVNATPLRSLHAQQPPPAVQSKKDAPSVDPAGLPSYSQLIEGLKPANPMQPDAGQHHPGFGQPAHPAHGHGHPAHGAGFDPQDGFGPDQQGFAQEGFGHPFDEEEYDYAAERPRRRAARRPRGASASAAGVVGFLRAHKSSLLVAAIVLVVLKYAAPRLSAVPQLLNHAGRFNLAGFAVIAASCGALHHVAGRYT